MLKPLKLNCVMDLEDSIEFAEDDNSAGDGAVANIEVSNQDIDGDQDALLVFMNETQLQQIRDWCDARLKSLRVAGTA